METLKNVAGDKTVSREHAYAAYERILSAELGLAKPKDLKAGQTLETLNQETLKIKVGAQHLGDEMAKGGVQKLDTAHQYGLPAKGGKVRTRDC